MKYPIEYFNLTTNLLAQISINYLNLPTLLSGKRKRVTSVLVSDTTIISFDLPLSHKTQSYLPSHYQNKMLHTNIYALIGGREGKFHTDFITLMVNILCDQSKCADFVSRYFTTNKHAWLSFIQSHWVLVITQITAVISQYPLLIQ